MSKVTHYAMISEPQLRILSNQLKESPKPEMKDASVQTVQPQEPPITQEQSQEPPTEKVESISDDDSQLHTAVEKLPVTCQRMALQLLSYLSSVPNLSVENECICHPTLSEPFSLDSFLRATSVPFCDPHIPPQLKLLCASFPRSVFRNHRWACAVWQDFYQMC